MANRYSRRSVIGMEMGALAGLAASQLAGCGESAPTVLGAPSSGTTKLQMVFWGPAYRDKVTRQALDLFVQDHPDMLITSQYTGFDKYWKKLDGLFATGNVPDLIQMDMRYLAQFVRKGQLLDLNALIYNQTIELADYDPVLLASSKVNNTIYGIPMGENYQCMVYDTALLAKSGLGEPPTDLTWETFADYCSNLTKALGNGVAGTEDASGNIVPFEVWLRERGKELYTSDGKVNFSVEDVADWFNYWSNLRTSGGCVSPDVQKALNAVAGPAVSTIIKGKAVFNFVYTNSFEAYQKLTKNKLALLQYPSGSVPGMFLKPSMLMSIWSQTQYPTESADLVSFITNDARAVRALGLDRGVPGPAQGRTALTPQLTPAQQQIIAYTDLVSRNGSTKVKEVLDPPGAGAVQVAMQNIALAVSFGQTSIASGAKSFYQAAQKAVS